MIAHTYFSSEKRNHRFSPAIRHTRGNGGGNQWITQASSLRAQGSCWIRNKFRWRWRVRLRIIKSRIINALNTWRRWDESESPPATKGRILRGWQVAPILRTDGCDGCNETQLWEHSARAFVTRGRFAGHDVTACFMGSRGCCEHGRTKNHPLRRVTQQRITRILARLKTNSE